MGLLNVAAGLSEAGKAVGAFAGAWTLQAQKDDAEKEKLALMQAFTAGENDKARASALALQKDRQAFEAPLQDAQTKGTLSRTTLAEDEARRKNAASTEVSGILGGGGKGEAGGFDSYGKRLRGYEGGSKNGGMVPNELGSGAYGPFQFMKETWADVRAKNADLNLPEDMRQADEKQHRAAFDRFTAANAKALKSAGFEPTAANLYLAHRFGAGGATTLLKAEDDSRLADILPPEWQRQNPDMRGQTVGSFKRLAEERMKGVTLDEGGGAKDTMPAEMRASLAALAKSDPKEALALKQRWQEHERTIEFNTKKAADIKIGEGGVAYALNAITMKVEPFTIDGQTMKFNDPEQAKARTALIQSLTTQLTDVSRSYMPEILSTETTVRTLMKDSMTSVDKEKQRELEEAKVKVKTLRDQYDSERKPILSRLNQIGGQLLGKSNLGLVPEEAPKPTKGVGDINWNKYLPKTAAPPATGGPQGVTTQPASPLVSP